LEFSEFLNFLDFEVSFQPSLTNAALCPVISGMSSLKQIRLAQKVLSGRRESFSNSRVLAKDIERCERSIVTLQAELEAVNKKHQGRRTTREDIAYLTDLLACANRKLTWEKHMASLQKRTPAILDEINSVRTDPNSPPPEETDAQMLQACRGCRPRWNGCRASNPNNQVMTPFRYSHRVTMPNGTMGNHIYYAPVPGFVGSGARRTLRQSGKPLLVWQGEGVIFPVIECRLRYRYPARYDDVLAIDTWLTVLHGVRMTFSYRISNQENQLVLEGEPPMFAPV